LDPKLTEGKEPLDNLLSQHFMDGRAGGVAREIKCLPSKPSKCEAQSSSASTDLKKEKKRKKIMWMKSSVEQIFHQRKKCLLNLVG
jgi:hypothetical protein